MNKKLKTERISMAYEDQRDPIDLHESAELGTVEYNPKIEQIHE